MSVDYYKLLQVQRNSRDVRKAVEAKLNLINDAYETGMARLTSQVMESVNPEVIFSTFLVGGTIGENGFQWFECTDSGSGNGPRKAAAIERTSLPCTMEELYNGATKKLKIYRDVLGASGRKITVVEVLTIEIKPGWKKGTKITFPEKGHDTRRGVIPADIVFIVDEKPHGVYKRDGVLNKKSIQDNSNDPKKKKIEHTLKENSQNKLISKTFLI